MDLLEKMSTYVRVVEAGSFSAAAKQLRVSAAAVSRQVATLEAELRAPLILRTTRSMSVTPMGRAYYERCLRILRDVDEAQAIGRGQGVVGVLKISAPVSFGLGCVVPYIHGLMAAHTGLRVDLRLEDRVVDLANEDIDVAIRVGGMPADSAILIAQPLLAYRRIMVAAPHYLQREGSPKTPDALATRPILTLTALHGVDFWTLRNGERVAHVPLKATFRTNTVQAARALALQGAGITAVPEWLVAEALERKELVQLLTDWEFEEIKVFAMYRLEHRGNRRVKALIQHLGKIYGKVGFTPGRSDP